MRPAALRLLLRLRGRAFLRKNWRALKRPRTAIPLLLIYGNMAFVFVMMSLRGFLGGHEAETIMDASPDLVAVGLSALLLLGVFLSLNEFPLVFLPAEIQWTFPAPFSRAAVTGYKLATFTPILVSFGIGIATFLQGGTRQWLLAVPALILYSALVFLVMVAVGMLGRTRRFRWATIGIAIAGVIAATAEVLPI